VKSLHGGMRCVLTSVKVSKAIRFILGLSDGRVIDGSRGGNSARWLYHACEPNCETIEDEGRILIHTLRPIEPGEELFIEYLLATDDPPDDDVWAQYACRYATADCRHSMLADAAGTGQCGRGRAVILTWKMARRASRMMTLSGSVAMCLSISTC